MKLHLATFGLIWTMLMIQDGHCLFSKLMKNAKKSMMADNCNCPCREYWTTKCSVEYTTDCKQLYSHRECKKIPHEKPMKVKETECQKCIQYYETVFETKSVRQCVDVYDEKCETKYPAKCVEDQSCTMLYQTQCDTAGYSQKCRQVPVQKCEPITKCHRIPKTTCKPIRKEQCGNKPTQVPKKQMKHTCLPYEARQADNLASCTNGIDSGYGAPSSGYEAPDTGYGAPSSGYGAPNSAPSSGYGVPNSAPSSGYGAPGSGYAAPSNGNTNNGYNAPSSGNNAFSAPNSGYTTTNAGNNAFSAPNSGYTTTNAGNAAPAPNSYSANSAFEAPLTPFNEMQSAVAPPPPLPPSTPNEDSYGSPNGNVIGPPTTLQNTFAVSAPNNYNSPLVGPTAISAPASYVSPLTSSNQAAFTTQFGSSQRAQEEFRTTLATIKVVDPPSELVGNGPFLPSRDTNFNVASKVHPNQRIANFKPSLKLPEGFVHQNGDVLNDPLEEVLESADSMKKMVFPQSSEENAISKEILKTHIPEQILGEDDEYDNEEEIEDLAEEDSKDHSEDGYGSEDNVSEELEELELNKISAIQSLLLSTQESKQKDVEETTESSIKDLLLEDPNPEVNLKRKRKRRKDFFQKIAQLRKRQQQSFSQERTFVL